MTGLIPNIIEGSKKHVLSMEAYQTAKPLHQIKHSIINLASNENPFPPPMAIQAKGHQVWDNLHRYPDPTGIELKTVIAERLACSVDHITLTNGSSEAIALLLQLFAGPGEEVIIANTAYALYETCIKMQGATPLKVSDQNWVHDLVAMQQAITAKTKMILLANPNNPTGSYINHQELKRLLEATPKNIIVVVDEAYFEYVTDHDYPDSIFLQKAHGNLVITRSFSKAYALAGLRVGYCIAHPSITDLLNRIRLSFNLNSIAMAVAKHAFNQVDYVEKTLAFIREEREKIQSQLKQWGIPFVDASANFIMMEFKDKALTIFNRLLEQGVLIRQLNNYQLPHHLRVSIGSARENECFLHALSQSISVS